MVPFLSLIVQFVRLPSLANTGFGYAMAVMVRSAGLADDPGAQSRRKMAPPTGLEPVHPAPEAGALSD